MAPLTLPHAQTASTAVPRLLSPTTRIRSSLARPRPLVNPDLPMSKQAVPPCNAHYLKGFCDVPRCRYEHRYELTPDQVEEMRRGAKVRRLIERVSTTCNAC